MQQTRSVVLKRVGSSLRPIGSNEISFPTLKPRILHQIRKVRHLALSPNTHHAPARRFAKHKLHARSLTRRRALMFSSVILSPSLTPTSTPTMTAPRRQRSERRHRRRRRRRRRATTRKHALNRPQRATTMQQHRRQRARAPNSVWVAEEKVRSTDVLILMLLLFERVGNSRAPG